MTTLLRDLIEIPDRVLAGDFVLALSKGIGEKSTIDQYVVTEQLAGEFDRALGIIQTAVETSSSRASYLDGSFGSGKSHFMAILYAILRGDPDARGKKGLADVVAKHDSWLRGRKFLLVPYHLPDAITLDSAILGGYVAHVQKLHPGAVLPAVYVDDELLATRASCGPAMATSSSSPSFPRETTSGGRRAGTRRCLTPRSPRRRATRSGGGWWVTC